MYRQRHQHKQIHMITNICVKMEAEKLLLQTMHAVGLNVHGKVRHRSNTN